MRVPALVVDPLEVVDVDHQHADRRVVAPRRALGRRGPAVEDARVREPGQRIVVGHVADALEELRLLQRHRCLRGERLAELDLVLVPRPRLDDVGDLDAPRASVPTRASGACSSERQPKRFM